MKFHYYPETDSLYIELTERNSVDSKEASPGVVLDYDADGGLVGIDIDHASSITDVSGLESGENNGGPAPSVRIGSTTPDVPHLAIRILKSIFRRSVAR